MGFELRGARIWGTAQWSGCAVVCGAWGLRFLSTASGPAPPPSSLAPCRPLPTPSAFPYAQVSALLGPVSGDRVVSDLEALCLQRGELGELQAVSLQLGKAGLNYTSAICWDWLLADTGTADPLTQM